jgi:hypothetical protein
LGFVKKSGSKYQILKKDFAFCITKLHMFQFVYNTFILNFTRLEEKLVGGEVTKRRQGGKKWRNVKKDKK